MKKIKLMPGNEGKDCPGNGTVPGIECQCDECDYLMCCVTEYSPDGCEGCNIDYCPRIAETDYFVSANRKRKIFQANLLT